MRFVEYIRRLFVVMIQNTPSFIVVSTYLSLNAHILGSGGTPQIPCYGSLPMVHGQPFLMMQPSSTSTTLPMYMNTQRNNRTTGIFQGPAWSADSGFGVCPPFSFSSVPKYVFFQYYSGVRSAY